LSTSVTSILFGCNTAKARRMPSSPNREQIRSSSGGDGYHDDRDPAFHIRRVVRGHTGCHREGRDRLCGRWAAVGGHVLRWNLARSPSYTLTAGRGTGLTACAASHHVSVGAGRQRTCGSRTRPSAGGVRAPIVR
jgi:hypothetical protein